MHRSVRGAHRRGELLRWRRLLGRDGPVGVALRNESGVGSRSGSADARRRMQGARRRGGRLHRKLLARRQQRAAGRRRRESRGTFGDAVGGRRWVHRSGVLGAVDQAGLALALDLAERGGGRPLVDALRVCERPQGQYEYRTWDSRVPAIPMSMCDVLDREGECKSCERTAVQETLQGAAGRSPPKPSPPGTSWPTPVSRRPGSRGSPRRRLARGHPAPAKRARRRGPPPWSCRTRTASPADLGCRSPRTSR